MQDFWAREGVLVVAANSTAALTQRQESQIGSEIEVYIGQLSLGVNVFIYTDTAEGTVE